jgi:arylformamidase
MCDMTPGTRKGWRGWRSWPEALGARPTGPWIDLSHKLNNDLPVPHVFPHPHFGRIASMPEAKLNITKIDMCCHIGTHLDAPLHLLMDGPGFDQIPASHLSGPGVVWHLDVAPLAEITVEMLEAKRPRLRPGDMLLVDTGWARRFGRDGYYDNPAFTLEAAQWLVDQGAKLVGVDFATPDLALPKRAAGFDWPVHQILLSNGVLVAENLADCSALADRRVEIVCGALNVEGADGSPARIMARTVEETA